MKKVLGLLLIALLLTGCSVDSKKFEYVSEEGSFLLDEHGIIAKDTDLSNKLVLTYYLEPTSYTSIETLKYSYDTIETLKDHEDVVIRVVPLMYLNGRYDNDLSAELGSLLLTFAEYDHDKIEDFLLKLQDKDYIPELQ